jgi:hypothetical protein
MHRYRFLSSLALTAVLVTPVTSQAAGRPDGRREGSTRVRVYDRRHRDYHVWDHHEDQVYRQYLGDNHRTYRRYSNLSRRQQGTYWTWRHTER